MRAEVAGLDPELVVHRAAPMAEVVGRGTSRERFALVLMRAFAGVSLLLAAVGLYGVLAYTVRQRTQEIGIRIALGATTAQVRALVLRQAAVVLARRPRRRHLPARSCSDAGCRRWCSRPVRGIPRILVATALLLTATGLVAAWLPARRASRVDPKTAMREGETI